MPDAFSLDDAYADQRAPLAPFSVDDAFDLSGLTPVAEKGRRKLDVSGLTPVDDGSGALDASGLKPFDTSGLTPVSDEPGLGSIVAAAAKKGVTDNIRAATQAKQLVRGQTPDMPDETTDATEEFTTAPFDFSSAPTSLADVEHLGKKVVGKTLHGLIESAPELAGAMGGGVLGAAGGTAVAGPVGTAVGGVAGTALGAGAINAAKMVAPFYAEELKKTPGDQDGAFSRALERAGTSGAFTGMGFALFGLKPFSGAVKNLALQALGVQPTVSAAGQVAQNAETGAALTWRQHGAAAIDRLSKSRRCSRLFTAIRFGI